jgi:lysine 6-dehydrogenase
MHRFVIVGAGRQGAAVAAYLLEYCHDTSVDFVDIAPANLQRAAALQRDGSRVRGHVLDAANPDARMRSVFQGAACVISCVPYFLNVPLTQLAIEAGAPFTDLGGNVGTVRAQLAMANACRTAGVAIAPDCGLAPGMLNMVATLWAKSWDYVGVKLYCGGLPQNPCGPWRYALTFSVHGLLNEYLDDCQVSRGGRLVEIPGMSEPERVNDLALPGEFEAFATSGGASLAPEIYAPRGVDYQYKTIRYPGHRDLIVALRDLGFFDQDARDIAIEGQPARVVPRDVTGALLAGKWPSDGKDLVVARAEIVGRVKGAMRMGRVDLIDYAVDRFTAMERTTGFPTAITAALLAGVYPGHRVEPGAYVPFQIVPPELMIDELHRAGVQGLSARDMSA